MSLSRTREVLFTSSSVLAGPPGPCSIVWKTPLPTSTRPARPATVTVRRSMHVPAGNSTRDAPESSAAWIAGESSVAGSPEQTAPKSRMETLSRALDRKVRFTAAGKG